MNNALITIRHNNSNFTISQTSRESGQDLIFFIHGLGCAQNYFKDVWSVEELTNYSIVTIDLPGFGDSPMNDEFSCDMKEYAEICRDVLSLFPLHNIHIVGHSMGGAIGVLLADMIRDRLLSFVNVEGNLVCQDCTTSRRRSSVSFEQFVSKQLPGLILTTSLSEEPGRRMWSHTIRKSDKRSLYMSSRSLVAWSDNGQLLKKFSELNCPRVYVYGDKNSFLHILSLLDSIQTVAISKSGHFPMIDNSREFYKFLSHYLDGVISARA